MPAPPLAVGDRRRADQLRFLADLHALHTFGPAADDTVQRELGGLATLHGAVEHRPVGQRAVVVHAHDVGLLRARAFARRQRPVDQARGRGRRARPAGGFGQIGARLFARLGCRGGGPRFRQCLEAVLVLADPDGYRLVGQGVTESGAEDVDFLRRKLQLIELLVDLLPQHGPEGINRLVVLAQAVDVQFGRLLLAARHHQRREQRGARHPGKHVCNLPFGPGRGVCRN